MVLVVHKNPEGEECSGSIAHDMPAGSHKAFDGGSVWYCVVTVVTLYIGTGSGNKSGTKVFA